MDATDKKLTNPAVLFLKYCFCLLKFLIFIENILFIIVITDYKVGFFVIDYLTPYFIKTSTI